MSYKIGDSLGDGGRQLSKGHTGPHAPMIDLMKGFVDDIAQIQIATITTTNATTLTNCIALVNDIKAKLNTVAGKTATVIK